MTNNTKKRKGSALYIAVMVVSVLLIMATNIGTIAFKQLQFSTYAKQSKKAFFAADTGLECVQYLDYVKNPSTSEFPLNNTGGEASKINNPGKLQNNFCANHQIGVKTSMNSPADWGATYATTTIYLRFSNSNTDPCVVVQVGKYNDGTRIKTTILSEGYDMGNNASGSWDCSAASGQDRRVERTLTASY